MSWQSTIETPPQRYGTSELSIPQTVAHASRAGRNSNILGFTRNDDGVRHALALALTRGSSAASAFSPILACPSSDHNKQQHKHGAPVGSSARTVCRQKARRQAGHRRRMKRCAAHQPVLAGGVRIGGGKTDSLGMLADDSGQAATKNLMVVVMSSVVTSWSGSCRMLDECGQ
jgi:hypothetical protein